ncbi:caspase family protein, partial [Bacteroidota bacterium]
LFNLMQMKKYILYSVIILTICLVDMYALAGIVILNKQSEFSGKVHLIAIGINDYSKTIFSDLKSAEQDAINFRSRLKKDSIIVELSEYLFFSKATKLEILDSFKTIAQNSMQNDVFIFYSGSMASSNGEILLSDASTISAEELFFASQNIICTNQLFFIDACHGELLINNLKQKLIRNPEESTISNSNRIILAVNGLVYETSNGGYFTLSYTENPTINILDLFSTSSRVITNFMSEFFSYTDTLPENVKFESVFFSEREFVTTAIKNIESSRTGVLDTYDEGQINTIRKGETLCFIIGCEDFDVFNSLSNTVNDAKSLVEILETQYYSRIIYLENPTCNEFRKRFMEIKNEYLFEDGSQFLLFAATHGGKDESGVGQMIFKDSYYDQGLIQNTYSLASIKKAVSQLNCTNSLMLIDICYSGTMFDDGTCNMPNAIEIPINSPVFQSIGPGSPIFKNFLNQKTNLFIGSSLDQEATDGTGDHSPFTLVLLEFLSKNTLPAIDSYHLGNDIRNNVMKKGSISIPMFCTYSCKDDGRFLFIKK